MGLLEQSPIPQSCRYHSEETPEHPGYASLQMCRFSAQRQKIKANFLMINEEPLKYDNDNWDDEGIVVREPWPEPREAN